MNYLLQFATNYNNNLNRIIECLTELKKNKNKRKKIISLSFVILMYSIFNFILVVNTINENIYLFSFIIVTVILSTFIKVGFFNFIIIELFKKETGENLTSEIFTKNKAVIETDQVNIIEPKKRNLIEQIEGTKETVNKENKNLTNPSKEVKLEITTNRNSETREIIILKLKKHNFVKLINPNCSEKILNLLLNYKIINNNGEWLSEKLKRKRDITLFIGKLFENNLLDTENQADVCRKATSFFDKKIDTGQLSTIIKFINDDNIPTNDRTSYQYLSFLDEIKI
jgi:hypothetical protein